MATTTPDSIYYPTSTTQIAPLETQFATMATSVQTALTSRFGTDTPARSYKVTNIAALDAISNAAVGDLAFMTAPGTGINPLEFQAVSGSGASMAWRVIQPVVAATRANLTTFINAIAATSDLRFQRGMTALVADSLINYSFTSTSGAVIPLPGRINPTSATGTGVSVDTTTGIITCAGTPTLSVVGGFPANSFDDFLVLFKGTGRSGTGDIIFRLGAGGGLVSTGYTSSRLYHYNIGSVVLDGSPTATSWLGEAGGIANSRVTSKFELFNPAKAAVTAMMSSHVNSNGPYRSNVSGEHTVANAYNDFTLDINGSTTFSGTVQIFGVS